MISVIITSLNSETTLAACLSALIPAAVDGLVREVIIADGGSTDRTAKIAESSGADTVSGGSTRSSRLIAGAAAARFPWLLFLPPDAVLGPGWIRDAEAFIAKSESGETTAKAAVFRFEIDDTGFAPRAFEVSTRIGHALCGVASAEQGLLISRDRYTALGGYRPIPVLEDLDITRRIGRRHLARLRTPLVTSPQRYRSEGYATRLRQHGLSLLLYGINMPLDRIAYRGRRAAARPPGS